MKKMIVLFLFFTLLCSISYSQQTNSGTNQHAYALYGADLSSSLIDATASATAVRSLMGIGFARQTRRIVHLEYLVGKKKPYKGLITFGIGPEQKSFQLIVENGETGVKADMVKPDMKVVNGKKIMIYKKIGRVNLRAKTTEFKEKIQIGDINVFSDEKTKNFVGNYKSYLNVLPEQKLSKPKKTPSDVSKASKTN